VAIQKFANGGLRKNAGDLTPELAKRIVAAVRKTPLSLNAAAKAVAIHPSELRYIVKRGSLPGADPLWVDTSVRIRELIAAAEARNFRRLERAATGGVVAERVLRPDPDVPGAEPRLVEIKEKVVPANVSAQSEIQRMIEADPWKVDPGAEDAPIVYMDLFSRPNELPPEILEDLLANGWTHATLSNQQLGLQAGGEQQPALADAGKPAPA
jgi:hypothetical protein